MAMLAIDTTQAFCAAAVRKSGQDDVTLCEEIGRGHAERLAPMVEEALRQADVLPVDLTRIGVTTGPGTFAGSRVGIAFARGLALAVNAEPIGISNFEWWACHAPRGQVLVLHDAKRGEVMGQVFEDGAAITEPERIALKHAIDHWSGHDLVIGSGAPLIGQDNPVDPCDMVTLLDLAEIAIPGQPVRPLYARPPDAKLPGGKPLT